MGLSLPCQAIGICEVLKYAPMCSAYCLWCWFSLGPPSPYGVRILNEETGPGFQEQLLPDLLQPWAILPGLPQLAFCLCPHSYLCLDQSPTHPHLSLTPFQLFIQREDVSECSQSTTMVWLQCLLLQKVFLDLPSPQVSHSLHLEPL